MKLKDAMVGAGVAALLLSLLRYTFAFGIISMTSYKAIYGALAAVPVFLMWIYLVWLAVLTGAVVTRALPDWRHTRAGVGVGVASRLTLALEILARLSVARRSGLGLTIEALAKLLGAPDTTLTGLLNELRKGHFIAAAEDSRWILARDLERTPLADLVHQFGLGLNFGDADKIRGSDIGKRLNQHLKKAADSEQTLLSVSLARIVL